MVVLLATLLIAAPIATATLAIPIPSQPPAPGVPPAPTTGPATTTAPATTTSPVSGTILLKLGSAGDLVKDLQRALRKRGLKVSVDGSFGRQTRAAVRILQRRMNLRATGKADAKLLKRLGIAVRTVASAPVGASAPVTSGARYLRAFPVNGTHTYTDDFGAPRATQSHQGNDVMADKGTPVVAVADGVIDRLTRVETGLGGIWIWLRDTEGNTFYYAHLDTIADGLADGSAVAVGQQIGTVGNTGDARYGAPHLHFEIHPGGAGAIDPYTELLAVDPNPPTR